MQLTSKASRYYTTIIRGTTPPRAYITEQEATRIQKQENGMAER
jgi:hypothetical protein